MIKKRIFSVMLCIMLIVFASCAAKQGSGLVMLHQGSKDISLIEQIVKEEMNIDLPDDITVQLQFDDFDSEGTGSAFCTADFTNSPLASEMTAQFTIIPNWTKATEVPERIISGITNACERSSLTAPDFKNGYYFEKYNCWAESGEVIVYTKEEATEIEIITYGFWDINTSMLYYYCTTVADQT